MLKSCLPVLASLRTRWQGLSSRRRWLIVLAVVAAGTVFRNFGELGGGSLPGVDWPVILPHLQTATARDVLGWWTGDWVQHNGYYRPLTSCSFLLDYLIVGDHALLWRVHDLALMVIVSCLIASLTWMLAESAIAGLVAGVWSAEPAVAGRILGYVSPRTDVLCAVYLLAALLLSLRWLRTGRRLDLALVLVATVLSLSSKEAGMALAALVPLTLWSVRAPLRRTAVVSGSVLAVIVVYWFARAAALHHSPLAFEPPIRQFPASSRADVFLSVVIPFYGFLSFYGTLHAVSLLLFSTWVTIAESVLAAAQWPLALLYRPRLFVLGILWTAMTIAPVLNYMLVAVHYAYIPHLGSAMLYGCAAAYLIRQLHPRLDVACEPG